MVLLDTIKISLATAVVLLIYAEELYFFFLFISNKLKRAQTPQIFLSKRAMMIHILAVAGIIFLAYAYFIEPYNIEVNTVHLSSGKLKKTSLRIVQISDLHCDKRTRVENKVVDIVNSLKPDVIFFTGDSINTASGLAVFRNTLKKLKANIGKFAVKGNIDVWYWNHQDLFKDTGFKLLDNTSERILKDGETFFVSGLTYENFALFPKILKEIPNNYYSIFLCHTPDLIESLKGFNVDLYLAGHTHGGQIRIPYYGAIVTFSKYGKKYEAGEFKIGNTILYVNRGIGTEGRSLMKMRFFCKPEITLFNIAARE